MRQKCSTCGITLRTIPYMSIFTVDSGIERKFCLPCIKMGYKNLEKIDNPTNDQIKLMMDFKKFIQQTSRRSLES